MGEPFLKFSQMSQNSLPHVTDGSSVDYTSAIKSFQDPMRKIVFYPLRKLLMWVLLTSMIALQKNILFGQQIQNLMEIKSNLLIDLETIFFCCSQMNRLPSKLMKSPSSKYVIN